MRKFSVKTLIFFWKQTTAATTTTSDNTLKDNDIKFYLT